MYCKFWNSRNGFKNRKWCVESLCLQNDQQIKFK